MQDVNTETKKQHFVPKLYLRLFALTPGAGSIRLFDIKSSRFVKSAALRDQASGSFYYGKDGKVEKELSLLEGKFAKVLKEMLATVKRPKYHSDDHLWLLTFIITTDFRNPVRAQQYEQLTNNALKRMAEFRAKATGADIDLDLLKKANIVPVDKNVFALAHLERGVMLCLDLHIKFLINETPVPFITSDNPVVHYNLFLERRLKRKSITGLGIEGLLVVVPLSEKVAVLFYDERMYYVGDRRKPNVVVKDASDVDQINLLQFANCTRTIFGGDNFTEAYARKLAGIARTFPNFHSMILHSPEPTDDGTGEIVNQSTDSVKTDLNISFVFLSTFASTRVPIEERIDLRPHAAIVVAMYEQRKRQQANTRKYG